MPKLNIGSDFSRDPAGRFYTDGDSSGEYFREEYLRPKLAQLNVGEKLEILLDDDVDTYGSSFLNEAFGGMVKFGYMRADDLLRKLEIKYSNPDYEFYANRIREYIRDSKFNSQRYVSTKPKN